LVIFEQNQHLKAHLPQDSTGPWHYHRLRDHWHPSDAALPRQHRREPGAGDRLKFGKKLIRKILKN
jgi:hypothetical protein